MVHRLPAVLVLIVLLPLNAAASSTDRVVQLIPGESVDDPSRYAWIMDDTSDHWTLAHAQRGDFSANDRAIINPGVSDATLWIRLDLHNAGDTAGSWVLSLERVLVGVADIYLQRGESVEHLLVNEPGSFRQSYQRFGTLAAAVELNAGERASVYVRFRGANWSGLQPLLLAAESFEFNRNRNLAIFLLLFGGVFTLVLYGTISFALLGRGIVVLYGIAQLSYFGFFAHMTGMTTIYLWPDNPDFARLISPLTVGGFVVSVAQFARLFFETRGRLRIVDGLLRASVWLGLLGIMLSPADYLLPAFDRRIALYLIYLAAIVSWLVLPLLACFATLRWDRNYWPLCIAWGLMSTYMIALMLVLLGVIVTLPLGEQSYVIVYIEALFLALAIALRVRSIKEQNLQAQAALNESLKRQLEESQRATRLAEEREWALRDLAEKGRMLLSAGHDTRQMLTALRSFSGGLRRGVDGEQARRLAGEIEQVADHLNNILTTTLNGSRSGGIADSVIALQTQTVSNVLSPLALIHGEAAKQKNIQLRIRMSSQRIVCDSVLVIRVLSNLLSNAIKYSSSDSGVLIGCRAGSEDLRFQVWDTGPGIDSQQLQLLLDDTMGAHRLDPEAAAAGSGVGLGIARDLAARMGGRIAAHSRPGRGSVFELVIPTAGLAKAQLPDLLVLDSDQEQHRRLVAMAENVSIRLRSPQEVSVPDPEEERRRDVLVLVDQHFEGRDGGVQASADFRDREGICGVVMMTFDQSAAAREDLAEHCDLILYKPISAAALLAAAARLVAR